jgi:transcription elongation factor Elf1
MDLEDIPALAGISIACAHCGVAEVDDFEVLAPDEMHVLACSACKQSFHLIIAECEHCGDETVLSWPVVPTPAQLRQAMCIHCGNRLIEHDSDACTKDAGR